MKFAASLNFIGLGAQPLTPEWGALVSRGSYNLDLTMWISTFSGIAIALVVFLLIFLAMFCAMLWIPSCENASLNPQ